MIFCKGIILPTYTKSSRKFWLFLYEGARSESKYAADCQGNLGKWLGLGDALDDQSAEVLTTIMMNILAQYEIFPETRKGKLAGQSYNGAATISGGLNGDSSSY